MSKTEGIKVVKPQIPQRFEDRLEMVGVALYGEFWKAALAEALGVSAQTMSRWLRGVLPNKDVDSTLIDVIGRARLATAEKESALELLERALIRHVVKMHTKGDGTNG